MLIIFIIKASSQTIKNVKSFAPCACSTFGKLISLFVFSGISHFLWVIQESYFTVVVSDTSKYLNALCITYGIQVRNIVPQLGFPIVSPRLLKEKTFSTSLKNFSHGKDDGLIGCSTTVVRRFEAERTTGKTM